MSVAQDRPVEGRTRRSWFDKPVPSAVGLRRAQAERAAEGLTTSGNVAILVKRCTKAGTRAVRARREYASHRAHDGRGRTGRATPHQDRSVHRRAAAPAVVIGTARGRGSRRRDARARSARPRRWRAAFGLAAASCGEDSTCGCDVRGATCIMLGRCNVPGASLWATVSVLMPSAATGTPKCSRN